VALSQLLGGHLPAAWLFSVPVLVLVRLFLCLGLRLCGSLGCAPVGVQRVFLRRAYFGSASMDARFDAMTDCMTEAMNCTEIYVMIDALLNPMAGGITNQSNDWRHH